MELSAPHLWMIAGPNGSGKSTFYTRTQISEAGAPLWIINPDLLTTEIASREGLPWLQANGVALDRIMTWLKSSVAMYKPVGFETVLSSEKYFPFLDDALARGFRLRLIYVALESPELHIERVARRVAEGGHHVDSGKIVARRARSFANLGRVLPKAQFAQVWDNSGSRPRLLFQKEGEDLIVYDRKAIPELTEIVTAAHIV